MIRSRIRVRRRPRRQPQEARPSTEIEELLAEVQELKRRDGVLGGEVNGLRLEIDALRRLHIGFERQINCRLAGRPPPVQPGPPGEELDWTELEVGLGVAADLPVSDIEGPGAPPRA